MTTFPGDYQELYSLQDRVLDVLRAQLQRFYLTGGTALGRFYLNHRYSDDLDFFIDRTSDFPLIINDIYNTLRSNFNLNEDLTLRADTYVRVWIDEGLPLKIDFVNEVPERWGGFNLRKGINLDNPANILANKLGAVVSRDEPKDVFDIMIISENYSFNWMDAYKQAMKKQLINETDIAMRLSSFPVSWFAGKAWIKQKIDPIICEEKLNIIADDLLCGKDNSLAKDKISITAAQLSPHSELSDS